MSFSSNIGTWNVSNVTNMDGMFYYVRKFNADIGNWQTNSVKTMSNIMPINIPASIVAQAGYPMA